MEIEFVITAFVSAVIGFIFGIANYKITKKINPKNDDKEYNEDKEYYVNYDFCNDNIIRLTDADFKNHICENNQSFAIYDDARTMNKIIRCKNKPRDLTMFGITFKERPIQS